MLKNFFITLGGIVLLLIIAFAFSMRTNISSVPEQKETKSSSIPTIVEEKSSSTAQFGSKELTLEVVSTERDRAKGLGGRDSLSQDAGMLFIFPEEDTYGFWMKDMRFPIDILWLDESFEVVHIAHNVSHLSYNNEIPWESETFYPKQPALYVLEVNAGLSEVEKVTVGDMLKVNVQEML